MRPFRFGVQPRNLTSRSTWIENVRRLEDSGVDVLLLSDHLGPQLGPFVALGAAAAATTRMRLGFLVLDNDFRHPAVVAKELATLDAISEGRSEIGLGAGWMHADYEQSGLPLDDARIRVDRLEESVRVIRGLMGDGPFSFAGKHYRITGLDGQPKPTQRPSPPILVGAGRKRLLAAAARVADIVGVHVTLDGRAPALRVRNGPSMTSTATAQRIHWIREASPDRFPHLELQTMVFMVAVDRPISTVAHEAEARFGIPAAEVADSVHILAGSVDGIVEQLLTRRERFGISYVATDEENHAALAPVIARLH